MAMPFCSAASRAPVTGAPLLLGPSPRLQIQLLRGLGRHKLHRRALHGFGNRFGVIEVVLLLANLQ